MGAPQPIFRFAENEQHTSQALTSTPSYAGSGAMSV